MRCPDCNKFVSFDLDNEPEVNSVDVDDEGAITADVRLVNCCADCGAELTEANFNTESDAAVAAFVEHKDEHPKVEHEPDVEEADAAERTERSEGKGRGRRTFYGYTLECKITCSCGNFTFETTIEDEMQASAMDEC